MSDEPRKRIWITPNRYGALIATPSEVIGMRGGGVSTEYVLASIADRNKRERNTLLELVKGLSETAGLQWHLIHGAGGKTLNAKLRAALADCKEDSDG